jgi:predicted metal-dependent hydrolase
VPPVRQARRREVLRDWYIRQAKEKILARVEQHAPELGIQFSGARVVENLDIRHTAGTQPINNDECFCRSSLPYG